MKQWWDRRRAGRRASGRGSKTQWYGGVWLRLGAVLGIGIVASVLSVAAVATVYRNALRTRIDTAAQALSSSHIDPLKDGADAPAVEEDYRLTEARLARIKQVNRDTRFVYLMARDGGGNVYFLADSEPEGSSGNSPRGERYPEASKALQAMFDNGRTVIEGPLRDSYGVWLSALSPVMDDETHQITAVVGIDIPAASYEVVLLLAGGIPLLLALLLAGVVYVRYQEWRRYQADVQFRAEMLSIASHELRTPLTGLRWSQESLLRQHVGNPAQKRMMQIMYDSTRRVQESIEDILQLARMESGKGQQLVLGEVDVRSVLEDIVVTQQLEADRRNVAVVFSAEWPKRVMLRIDGQRMKHVFNNVLSNMVKYSDQDTKIMLGYQQSKDGEQTITMRGENIGELQEEQTEVWDSSSRAASARRHDVNGAGMGLYLARHIVVQHGGRMWLETEKSEGTTTVYVALPKTVAVGEVKGAS